MQHNGDAFDAEIPVSLRTFSSGTSTGPNVQYIELKCLNRGRYQRDLNERDVAKIVREGFKPEKGGVLKVGVRADNSMWIVDGQHRMAALQQIGQTRYLCEIFRSDGEEHEANTFIDCNMQRSKLSGFAQYRGSLFANKPWALKVANIIAKHGFKVESNPSIDNIRCPSLLRTIVTQFSNGDKLLDETLGVVVAVEGHQLLLQARALRGLASFINRYKADPVFDLDKVVDSLNKFGTDKLINAARELQQRSVAKVRDPYVDMYVYAYNYKKTKYKLSPGQ